MKKMVMMMMVVMMSPMAITMMMTMTMTMPATVVRLRMRLDLYMYLYVCICICDSIRICISVCVCSCFGNDTTCRHVLEFPPPPPFFFCIQHKSCNTPAFGETPSIRPCRPSKTRQSSPCLPQPRQDTLDYDDHALILHMADVVGQQTLGNRLELGYASHHIESCAP